MVFPQPVKGKKAGKAKAGKKRKNSWDGSSDGSSDEDFGGRDSEDVRFVHAIFLCLKAYARQHIKPKHSLSPSICKGLVASFCDSLHLQDFKPAKKAPAKKPLTVKPVASKPAAVPLKAALPASKKQDIKATPDKTSMTASVSVIDEGKDLLPAFMRASIHKACLVPYPVWSPK